MPATRAEQLLRISVALVWFCTGVFVLSPYYRDIGTTHLARLGLPGWIQVPVCIGEVLFTAWLLTRRTDVWVALLQTGPVLFFTLALGISSPALLVHPYGVLTKNLPLLAMVWTAYLFAKEGYSPRALALLRYGIAIIWFTEGLFPKLLFQHPLEISLFTHWGLSETTTTLLIRAAGVSQLVACGLVLFLEGPLRVYLLSALFGGLLVLPLMVLSQQPQMLVHPFGPMTKNFPILAGTWVLLQQARMQRNTNGV